MSDSTKKEKEFEKELLEHALESLRNHLGNVKNALKSTRVLEIMGQIEKDVEVGPRSFIQVMEAIKVADGVAGWAFRQGWMDKMAPEDQATFLGTYIGETVGNYKVIAIYKPTELGEQMLKDGAR